MNLLLLHCHDMGRYNSAYGHALPTPNMARFGRESMLFRNAHCAAPTCSPSRAAMLTGKTAHEVGMFGLVHRGWDLNDRSSHLASLLSEAGWHTTWIGDQHEFGEKCGCPYDEHVDRGSWELPERDLDTAQKAATWLRAREDEKPFFLWCGFFWPHEPFAYADEDLYPRSQQHPPSPLPDQKRSREDWAGYAASVGNTDLCFGRILNALEESGHAEDTIVIITTDHGVPFPHMKCNLTQHGTGITFMLRDPRNPGRDRCTDALVSHLDLVPTVLDLLGAPIPQGLHGTSLRPLLEGTRESVREDTFAEVTYHGAYEPKRSVRTLRWNYIRSWYTHPHPPLANCDHTITKDILMDHGWPERGVEQEELYDLVFDPQERRNLAALPEYAEIKADMASRLDRWMTDSHDPLLNGEIPLSPTGMTNTHESLHPKDAPFEYGEDYRGPRA